MSRDDDHYDVHGVRLAVSSDDAAVRAQVAARLRWFARPGSATHPDVPVRVVTHPATRPFAVPLDARVVYEPEGGEVVYDPGADLLWVSARGVTARVSPGEGSIEVRCPAPSPEQRWLASHGVLSLSLHEVLKRRGLFPLHAAACVVEDRAALFVGTSGAGKSTLSLAFLRAGAGFLADDTVFLKGTQVLAFPDEVDVLPTTLALLPGLTHLGARPLPDGAVKRPLDALRDLGVTPTMSAPAGVLVFPRVGHGASAVTRLTPAAALAALLPNLLLTEPAATQQHADALTRLVHELPAFALRTGQDLGTLPARLPELMRTAAPAPSAAG